MPRPKGYKCSPETIAKQKATREANKAEKAVKSEVTTAMQLQGDGSK